MLSDNFIREKIQSITQTCSWSSTACSQTNTLKTKVLELKKKRRKLLGKLSSILANNKTIQHPVTHTTVTIISCYETIHVLSASLEIHGRLEFPVVSTITTSIRTPVLAHVALSPLRPATQKKEWKWSECSVNAPSRPWPEVGGWFGEFTLRGWIWLQQRVRRNAMCCL
jgi:arsenate reductase-like glutaredoxin family protein